MIFPYLFFSKQGRQNDILLLETVQKNKKMIASLELRQKKRNISKYKFRLIWVASHQ